MSEDEYLPNQTFEWRVAWWKREQERIARLRGMLAEVAHSGLTELGEPSELAVVMQLEIDSWKAKAKSERERADNIDADYQEKYRALDTVRQNLESELAEARGIISDIPIPTKDTEERYLQLATALSLTHRWVERAWFQRIRDFLGRSYERR